MKDKIGLINFISCFLFGTNNLITYIITDNHNIIDFVMYVSIFYVLLLPIYLLGKNKIRIKINAMIFVITGSFAMFFGDVGNTTGIIYLCFAYYIFSNIYKNVILILIVLASILFKYIFLGFLFTQGLNLMLSYFHIAAIFYVLIYSKKPKIVTTDRIDETTKEILELLVMGYKRKQIADTLNMSESAITQRILRTTKKFNCINSEELIKKLSDLGYFCHNSDI